MKEHPAFAEYYVRRWLPATKRKHSRRGALWIDPFYLSRWVAGEWSMCSASCGGGSRTRAIFCTEENGNETTKVNKGRNEDNLNTRNPFILNSGISVPESDPISFREKHSGHERIHAREEEENLRRELREFPFLLYRRKIRFSFSNDSGRVFIHRVCKIYSYERGWTAISAGDNDNVIEIRSPPSPFLLPKYPRRW